MMRIAALLAALAAAFAACAQSDYPSRPIRLITPFNPGGAIDVYSRLIAEPLGKRLGQNVVVEAIAGANTIVGTRALVRAAPDGHTFMITTMSTAANNKIPFSKTLPYDPERDLAPITQLSYGTVRLVAAGAVKPIAMTGPQRSASIPDLATFSEQGIPNVDLAIWVGAYAPAGTPRPILERLRRELRAVIHAPEVREKMIAQGQTPIGNTPEEFVAIVRADFPKWEALIRASGAKIE
ncbi:MAG: tripartite tricarboxylate transporter substrate binding protein [Pseudomonadota bacterium]